MKTWERGGAICPILLVMLAMHTIAHVLAP
jgi:hypothetical protein